MATLQFILASNLLKIKLEFYLTKLFNINMLNFYVLFTTLITQLVLYVVTHFTFYFYFSFINILYKVFLTQLFSLALSYHTWSEIFDTNHFTINIFNSRTRSNPTVTCQIIGDIKKSGKFDRNGKKEPGYFALCTLDGTIKLMEECTILWSVQVSFRIFL